MKLADLRDRVGYQAGLLGAVALAASAALGLAHQRTAAPIAAAQARDLQDSLRQVLPAHRFDNDLATDALDIADGAATTRVYRATLVTLVDMALNAWLHELYKVLGLFIALIVVNCAILGRAEAYASRSPVLASAVDGLAMGLGFTFALTLIGAVREVLGSGTLFGNAHLLLGEAFAFLELKLIPDYKGALLMILPPGGFLALGFLLAAKRVVEEKFDAPRNATGVSRPLPSG